MFDITGKRMWFYLISAVIVIGGIISLATLGLKPGIEFSSGSELTGGFEREVSRVELREELDSLGYTNAIIRQTEEDSYLIRTEKLSPEEKTALVTSLNERFGGFNEQGFYHVGETVAQETANNAAIAVAVAAIGVLLYVTWAFRRMPHPFHYGTCAIAALAHDILIVLGVFSIIGSLLQWEINLMFITGVLAVIGYSVNNTVVIFDRIRENLKKGISPNFEITVNNSLVETMGRSLNTSLTTLLVVLALLFFVGASIQNFVTALLIGIIAGTYSSVCIAPLLLVSWEKRGGLKAKSQG
ncbi:protein translocase subunit SecF [Chloroflexota bacterium]